MLAEFGVILLLFIIGIELSVIAFLRVLRPAVIATFGQICCFILLALSVNAYFTWTLPQILLIGFILTLSLTAVALMGIVRAWPEPRTTHAGQLTVGVLVAQDIAVAPMLVFAQSAARCVSAMAIIAGAGGDCITDIGGFADMGWQNCPPKIANGNAAGR